MVEEKQDRRFSKRSLRKFQEQPIRKWADRTPVGRRTRLRRVPGQTRELVSPAAEPASALQAPRKTPWTSASGKAKILDHLVSSLSPFPTLRKTKTGPTNGSSPGHFGTASQPSMPRENAAGTLQIFIC